MTARPSPFDSNTLSAISTRCRRKILKMITEANSGHPGGSLSVIDLLVYLFFHEMDWDPNSDSRERLVLSKGHAVPALYAVFSEKGLISDQALSTLRQPNSKLQGHPDRALMPEVEASTGSLGQGLSIAQGLALGSRLKGLNKRVFCVLGDGEIQEGQVWETAMSAPKFKLDNLIAILDHNRGQIDGYVKDVMDLEPLADKWRSFNWDVQVLEDGHNFEQWKQTFERVRTQSGKPTFVIAKTIKGKGISFMENNIDWHGKAPSVSELEKALNELGGSNV